MKKIIFIILLLPLAINGQTFTFRMGAEPGPTYNEPTPTNYIIELSDFSGNKFIILDESIDGPIKGGIVREDLPFLPTKMTIRNGNFICYTRDLKTCNGFNYSEAMHFCNTTFEYYARNITVYPNLKLKLLNTENTVCGKFKFEGIPANHQIYYYKWEYQIGTDAWVSFKSSLNYVKILEFDINDIPNLAYNQQIRIRLKPCSTSPASEILSVSFLSCSPQLLTFNHKQTTCSYTDDGSFSMVLDKNIPSGKKLVASLFYEFEPDTKPDVYNFLDQKDTTILTGNGDGTFTYQWPNDTSILPGKYKVRYQTYDTTTDNPEWDSLEGTEVGFTIGNPLPITFNILPNSLKQVSCFKGNNGQVQIEADGGVGNFEYQLNTDTWKPFTTGNTQLVNKLPKGNYTLKVQDGNKCTEKL